jgi:flavodoxin
MAIKSLLVLYSYHHNNTGKIAGVIAKVLNAQIKRPGQLDLQEFQENDLIGFGSGIYDDSHHKSLLDLVDKLPQVKNRKAFIFSTFGVPAFLVDKKQLDEFIVKNHSRLRINLQSKGYTIIDEFSCVGFNTNSFLKIFGGINKGRPDAEDLSHAEEFAENLKKSFDL